MHAGSIPAPGTIYSSVVQQLQQQPTRRAAHSSEYQSKFTVQQLAACLEQCGARATA